MGAVQGHKIVIHLVTSITLTRDKGEDKQTHKDKQIPKRKGHTTINTIPTTYNTRTRRGKQEQSRKLYYQHAVMGCLAPEFRHHQVGTVQGHPSVILRVMFVHLR